MDLFQILILSLVQGAAELLPVSSSAHVIVAEKLMGLDPTAPEMTLLLVMLHTGTMFAVIVYFWKSWVNAFLRTAELRRTNFVYISIATFFTGVVGLSLLLLIKHLVVNSIPNFEIEDLFGNAKLMATALATAGIFIIVSSRFKTDERQLSLKSAAWIGAVQGLCLPFRGFSRSGATISTGLVMGIARRRAEEFSFALAVVLTPVVIVKELYRLFKHQSGMLASGHVSVLHLLAPGLFGMVFSFFAGLLALKWLSNWLENGLWYVFGGYCLLASVVVLWIG